MKATNRDKLLLKVIHLLRNETDGVKKFDLLMIGESLILDHRELKKKEIEAKIEDLSKK